MPAGGDGNPRRERQMASPYAESLRTGYPCGLGHRICPYLYPGTRRVPLPPEDGNDNFTVL